MPRGLVVVSGPTPSRILFKLSKEGFLMIKDPVYDAGKAMQKRAKEMAQDFKVSGDFRKSIGRRSRAMKKEGEISVTVGVRYAAPAFTYSYRVEAKHHVFKRVEHEFRPQVEVDVRQGMKNGLRRLKIRR